MLAQLRKGTRNIVTAVIVGVLIIAFAIWGVNDVFSGVGITNLGKVGGQAVAPRELAREVDLFLRAQRQQGQNLSQQQAIEAGVHRRLLDNLLARRALASYAEKLGVSASDTRVAEEIRKIPATVNSITGAFDRDAYQTFLREYGYGQQEFEEELRDEIGTTMLRQALVAGTRAPSSYGAMLLAFESERRTISVAEAPMRLVGQIAAPTDAQIQELYNDNAERFRVPEYRALTLVLARASDFAARVDVPEEQIRQDFEARRASLQEPERRTFLVIAAPDEAKAREAARRLGARENPEAVAQALGLQVIPYENQPANQVADSGVRDAVFAMAAGAAPAAVRGAVTPWAAVQLTNVTPAREATYETQRQHLRDELALTEASEMLNAATEQFEDARSAGTAAAEAARTAGLVTVSIPAVDAQGRDPQGQPVEAIANYAELLRTAFETTEGEASDFIPAGEGTDAIVSVDTVTPETTRPLAEVREDVVQAYYMNARVRRLREIGQEVVAALDGGADFAQVARQRGLGIIARSQPIDRRQAAQLPAQRLAGEIFSHNVGDAVMDLRSDGGAVIIARIEAITRTDPAEAPQMVEQARLQIQQALQGSIDESFANGVMKKTPPRVNEGVLNRLYPPTSSEDEDAAPAQ